MYTLRDNLQMALGRIENAIEDLDSIPNIEGLSDLFQALQYIDEHYRHIFCADVDENFGENPGSTYEFGTSMEYYIESSWWHDVSLALRKLGKGAKSNDDQT